MYLRKPFLIFALTLQSYSFPLDSQKRSEHPVVRARASYSVVDVDGNPASTHTYSTSPVIETVIQTFRSKYTFTPLTTNQPAGFTATAQGLSEILPPVTTMVSRSKTICLDSISAKPSIAPIPSASALPANPSYFIVNPEGTTTPLNMAVPTMTITIQNGLRPYNTASALLPNLTNAIVRIFSSASPTPTTNSFSTSLQTPAKTLSNISSKRLQPGTTATSVYGPTRKPSSSYNGFGNTYHFPNISSTTSARWNTKARVASPSLTVKSFS